MTRTGMPPASSRRSPPSRRGSTRSSARRRRHRPAPGSAGPSPATAYFASVGSSFWWHGAITPGGPNGIFKFGGGFNGSEGSQAITICAITDGTSNTIAFGEWRMGDFDERRLSVPQDIVNLRQPPPGISDLWGDPRASMPTGAGPFMQWINMCAGFAPTSTAGGEPWRTNMSYMGRSWNQGMFGYTMGNTLLPPNPRYPNCRTCSWDGDLDCPGMYGMSSFHPGGGNAAFADGSVKFLKATTAMQTYLGSRFAQRGRGALCRLLLI